MFQCLNKEYGRKHSYQGDDMVHDELSRAKPHHVLIQWCIRINLSLQEIRKTQNISAVQNIKPLIKT